MYCLNCRWWENLSLTTASLKALKMTLDSYPRINDLKLMGWNLVEGGNWGMPHHPTPGTQQSYIMWKDSIKMCSNQDKYWEWPTCKVKKTKEWPTQASTYFEHEHKGKLGKNTKCSKGTKGCRLKYMQAMETMVYSFVALQFLLFHVSKGFLI